MNIHSDSIAFDWGIFDVYIASITHQRIVLSMLLAECKRLPADEVDPKYHAQTWQDLLTSHEKEWAEFATQTGLAAAKELYWGAHSMTCEDREIDLGGNALEKYFDFYFGCEDFEGRMFILRRKLPPGYFGYMYFKVTVGIAFNTSGRKLAKYS